MVRRERDGELDDVAPAARRPAPSSLLSAASLTHAPKNAKLRKDIYIYIYKIISFLKTGHI